MADGPRSELEAGGSTATATLPKRRFRRRGFFDRYPAFTTTSTTAASVRRLNWRYRMLIKRQGHLLKGARVLDIASHDGRWSFAALRTGAAHVTGIEFREDLVRNARHTLRSYGSNPNKYRFIVGDVFKVLAEPRAYRIRNIDVVLCLGFLYHTTRYSELLLGIRRLQPKKVILDTAVMNVPTRTIHLFAENTAEEKNAAQTHGEHGAVMVTGRPSESALEFMLNAYGFKVVEKIDWPSAINGHRAIRHRVERYADGRRVTWIVEPV